MTLVDTSVWSLALRRRPAQLGPDERRTVAGLERLLEDDEAALIGPVRQEVLTGVRHAEQFARLQVALGGCHVLLMDLATHDSAAACSNECRAAGVAAGPIDMMICAAALRHQVDIFTTDGDFARYAARLPIRLHVPA